MQFLVIKNWEKYQHYKDRDPSWIKLYRDTLTSLPWVLGTDLSRLLQLASTMMAARYSNKIPAEFDVWRKVANLDCKESQFSEAINHLVSHDFLEFQGVAVERKHNDSAVLATRYAREEKRERREEESREEPMSGKPDRSAVEQVFKHWQEVHRHPDSRLTDARRKVIRKALTDYTVDQLCEAISGYRNSPHHMGQNDRGTTYDSIELLLRDAQRIDAGLMFARNPPRPPETAYEKIMRATTPEEPNELFRIALTG